MRNTFYYSVFILLLLSISSCNNCKDPACPKLTTDEASWFPYNENDTLAFKETSSDSLLLFPLHNYGNSSNVYTPSNGDECNKYCRASMIIYSYYFNNNIELFSSIYAINRIKENLYVVISPSTGIDVSIFNTESYFDLRHANKLDTISINGELLEDVYQYTCYPAQDEVAETYVKKGMGLVKIVFRNGQEFDLVEHIKAK